VRAGGLPLAVALGALIAIQLVALLLLPRITFNNAPELWFPADAPAARVEQALRERFPGDQTLIGLFTPPAPFATASLQAIDRLVAQLEQLPMVDRVFAITRQEQVVGDAEGIVVRPLVDLTADPAPSAAERRATVLADRFAPGWLVGRDGRSLAVVVRALPLQGTAQRQALESAFYQAVAAAGLSDQLSAVSGLVALDTAELRSILRDTALFTPIIGGLGLILLYWIVGRWVPVAIAILGIGTVEAVALGLLGALGQPYTLVTAMLPTLLLAYTVANLLHLYSALERSGRRTLAGRERVLRAVAEVHKPALFNVLSTSAGVLSLLLVPIPPIQTFACTAAVGTLTIYGVVFHLLPPLLIAWDRHPRAGRRSGLRWARHIALALASFGLRHRRRVVAVTLLGSLLAAPLLLRIEVESDLLAFFSAHHPLNRSTRLVEGQLQGITTLELVATAPAAGDLQRLTALRQLARVQQAVAAMPEVDRTLSLVDLVEVLHGAFSGSEAAAQQLPANDAQLAQLLLLYDGRELAELVDRPFRHARILIYLRVHGANAIQRVIERIEAQLALEPGPIRWQVAGSGRLFSDLEDQLVEGQVWSFFGAFGQIFLMLLLLWRSLAVAVIGMIPNLAPLYFVFVVMGATGIYLDTATVLIASVVLGITVDDTIHFLHAYLWRRRRGVAPVSALMRSFELSGRAVVAISLLLVSQFLLLTLSDFQPTAHYGLLAAIGLLTGQLLELVLLPVLLLGWEQWRAARRDHRPIAPN